MSNVSFQVTESFGTDAQIRRLTEEAINMARATGSVGATCNESNWSQDTGKTTTVAMVTVSRV
jgi:hypothetical protein